MSGSAGIWGPSCISSAQLAIHEINQRAGISGAPIVPLFMDSDDSAGGALEREIAALIEGFAWDVDGRTWMPFLRLNFAPKS